MVLRNIRDVQCLAHIAVCGTFLYLALSHSWLWMFAAALFNPIAIAHNHAHVPLFRIGFLNWLTDLALQLTCGFPQQFWKFHHLQRHHPHPWGDRDWSSPYSYSHTVSPSQPASKMYFAWTYLPLFVMESFVELIRRSRPRELAQFAVTTLTLASLFGWLMWQFGVGQCLLVFGFVYWRSGIGLGNANYLQHWACYRGDGEHWAWTFTSKFYNALTYNQGYHMLHHLKPSLHWTQLPVEHHRDSSYTVPELIEHDRMFPLRNRWFTKAWLAEKINLQEQRLASLHRDLKSAEPSPRQEFIPAAQAQLFPVG